VRIEINSSLLFYTPLSHLVRVIRNAVYDTATIGRRCYANVYTLIIAFSLMEKSGKLQAIGASLQKT